jgi:hypothetical protein
MGWQIAVGTLWTGASLKTMPLAGEPDNLMRAVIHLLF